MIDVNVNMVSLGPAMKSAQASVQGLNASNQTQSPQNAVSSEQVKPDVQPVDIKQAVAYINEFVQNAQRDLNFSVDEESGVTIVKVLDRHSGDLIRQIPNDVVLDMAKNIQQFSDINLLSALG